jgi:proline iminopeptidase
MRTEHLAMGVPGLIRHIVLVLLTLLLGVAAGLSALIGTAAITDRPPLFVLAGLAAFCLVYLFGLVVATRGIAPASRRRVQAIEFIAGAAAVAGAFALTALRPLDDPRLPPASVQGQTFWELPTGSRIAYVQVPAAGNVRPTPVIVLHGGPGVPDMKGDAEFFGRLARDGFDVYVYDQVGRGRSLRLADPRGYTLERDIADLEAIRRQIGAERVVLIGHSYGGKLAAAYAAANPEQVAKMVLSAPEDPAPDASVVSMVGRLSLREQFAVYALLLQPRALLGYTLLQVNPHSAYAFAGDAATPCCRSIRIPPTPSRETRRWMPASTASITAHVRHSIVQANHSDPTCTAWASTPTTTSSLPRAPRTPTFYPPSPGRPFRLWSSKGAATTSRGPRPWPT